MTLFYVVLGAFVFLAVVVFYLMRVSAKAATATVESHAVTQGEEETQAVIDTAQKAVDRPSKDQLVSDMGKGLFLIPLLLALAGCNTVVTKYQCPPMPHYDPKVIVKGSEEVAALPSDSTVLLLVTDYRTVRKACGY